MSARKFGVARYPSGRLKVTQPTDGMFVYVVTAEGQGACKVGVSNNPLRRIEGLSHAGLLNIRMFWAGSLPTREQAFKVEKLAHLYLRERGWMRARREWFDCSAAFARAEVIRAASFYGWEFAPEKQMGWPKKQPVENRRDGAHLPCNLGWSVA